MSRLVAHALNALDLDEESAIAIDMPMNVESVIIYLAIVLAGHVVVSIADSFSPREISTRLKISKAKAIFTQVNQGVCFFFGFIQWKIVWLLRVNLVKVVGNI